MQEQLIRKVKLFGNGAHVSAPKEWLNEDIMIVRLSSPLDIKENIIKILKSYSEDILGIYLVGSYARSEQREDSDIDVIAITSKTNKRIKEGKYEIILISRENLEKQLKNNILPILPMLKEAKPLFNSQLIKDYKETKITKNNLSFHIETTKSALRIFQEAIRINEISENLIYSLVLRLREVYIVDCLIKKQSFSNQDFSKIIKNLNSEKIYSLYQKDKKGIPLLKEKLNKEEFTNIADYISKKLKEKEKWVKGKS